MKRKKRTIKQEAQGHTCRSVIKLKNKNYSVKKGKKKTANEQNKNTNAH